MARHGAERALHSLPIMPAAQTNGGSPNSAGQLSPLDLSRIPRLSPSPQALRRSGSLRLRGERSQLTPTASRTHQQDFFPVITENGSDTPIKRSSSSLSLTPLRGRARASPGCAEECSDAESVRSFGSNYSTASACDHASFALNGTTWSGRSRRYVVHCSSHAADGEEYLTPTQRAARQVRKFQALLREARAEIEDKDRELFRLTKELVELRLYKAALNSPDDKTDSSEAATVRETTKPESARSSPGSPGSLLASPRTPDRKPDSSLVDSGLFDDGSVHSRGSAAAGQPEGPPDGPPPLEEPAPTGGAHQPADDDALRDEERQRTADLYESRIEEMHRRHVDELQLLKQGHNDRVEGLLHQLAEVSTRYCEARPALDAAEARARDLDKQLAALEAELAEQRALLADQEERNKQMYLKMYSKGQEAARMEQADQVFEQAQKNPSKVSVAELLQQLTVKEAELENVKPFQDSSYSPEPLALASRSQSLLSVQEAVSLWVLGTRKAMYRRILESRNNQGALDPEITLQFLKSAVYYFLTDKENLHGHLNAIESILGFTDSEKLNIDRIYRSARK